MLVQLWEKCITKEGDYVEKWYIVVCFYNSWILKFLIEFLTFDDAVYKFCKFRMGDLSGAFRMFMALEILVTSHSCCL